MTRFFLGEDGSDYLYIVIPTGIREADGAEGPAVFIQPEFAQIVPGGVPFLYERQLLLAPPAFDLFFPEDGLVDILECLKPNEPGASVFLAESLKGAVFMLLNSPEQIVRYAAVQNTRAACHQVDIEAEFWHLARL